MDAFSRLAEAGKVAPPEHTTIETAVEHVLTAACDEERTPAPPARASRRRRRPFILASSAVAAGAAAAAVVAGVLTLPGGAAGTPGAQPPPAAAGHTPATPTTVGAHRVQLIADSSWAAAVSGTATVTSKVIAQDPANLLASLPAPSTRQVRFSGENINVTITAPHNAKGVQNRLVDGQVYLYTPAPDGHMRWVHDTAPHAAESISVPHPRILLQAVRPAAHFQDLGTFTKNGMRLEHLKATNPGVLGHLNIPDVHGNPISFELWVDSHHVVHRMAWTSPFGAGAICPVHPQTRRSKNANHTSNAPQAQPHAPVTNGPLSMKDCHPSHTHTRFTITFANLGNPQTITAPSGAIDLNGHG
jgi:hypothetical protein